MSVFSKIFSRSAALIASSIAFALLAACSSSDTTEVKADFEINGVKGTISGQNVTIDLTTKESCSTVTSLVTNVQANGAAISPDPMVARDYSKPVDFTITAPDGTKVVYTVTVKGNTCTDTPAPAPVTPVTPTACTPDAIGSTGYSLVFKGCSAANVAEYYDKTECVRDNTTGLIWQGQMPAGSGHLRANDQYKSNFDSTTELQKWNGLAYVAPTQADLDAPDNSIGFKNAVNGSNLCGSGAWRLPTKDELLGIVKINPTTPMIDTDWFLNTHQYGRYWSATPYEGNAWNAWVVRFDNGNAVVDGRMFGLNDLNVVVRLVR